MKIELIYDPVAPATTVWVNGQAADITDMYGFLYPVRNCLLQTWLYPSGSWQGLAYQLKELARGDDIELIFYGRQEDYVDVTAAVANLNKINLRFCAWDSALEYESAFLKLDFQMQKILDDAEATQHKDDEEAVTRKKMIELYPETVDALTKIRKAVCSDWLREIESEADYSKVDQEALSCCIVTDSYMDSYEKLEHLDALTRSMRRSKDMICCYLPDDERRKQFSSYANQYTKQTISFVGSDLETYKEKLYDKYGKAYLLRQKLYAYQTMLETLEQCFQEREVLAQKKRQLAAQDKLGIAEIREQEKIKIRINWFDRKSVYLTEIRELLQQLKSAAHIKERSQI